MITKKKDGQRRKFKKVKEKFNLKNKREEERECLNEQRGVIEM